MSRSQLLMNYNAENNWQEQMQPAQTPGPVVILWKVSSQALRLAQCLSLLDNDPSGFQVYATEIQHKYQKTTPFTHSYWRKCWSKKYFWIFFLSLASDFRAKIQLKDHSVHWLSNWTPQLPPRVQLGEKRGRGKGLSRLSGPLSLSTKEADFSFLTYWKWKSLSYARLFATP